MPELASGGFEIGLQTRSASEERDESEPFRIAVFGDFSGRANRGIAGGTDLRNAAQSARPVMIDRDNFDRVLAKLAPALEIAPVISLSFSSLDDFHPDSLFRKLPSADGAIQKPADNLLDRMVEESNVPVAARADAAFAEQLRAILHHSDFQALEAAWRSLFFLTQRLETGVDLQIYLFDLSRQELYDDLHGATDLRNTAFYRHIITHASSKPWSLLIGNFSFAASLEDIELLARIGMIAQQARAPFLAAADPTVLGCDSLTGMPDPRDWHGDTAAAQLWHALRELPEASSIGLSMPRFLLRLPYGKDTSPTEEFPFEEMPGTPGHDEYLWGNPAIAAAVLLGKAFAEDGWNMRPGSVREIDRLPLHIYEREGESVAQPCAEAWLSDRAAQFILGRGIMPLVSARDSDRILLARFQSVADPPKALAGRW